MTRRSPGGTSCSTGLALLLLAGCSSGSEPPGPQEIGDVFDDGYLESAAFVMADEGMPTGQVEFTDGVYQGADGGEMSVVEGPIFTDLDFDGDLDAAAVLEWSGTGADDGWRGLYGWLWDDGEVTPTPWPLAWQWSCAGDEDSPMEFGEIAPSAGPGSTTSQDKNRGVDLTKSGGNYCGGDFDPSIISAHYFVWIQDEVPVTTQGSRPAATVSCWRGPQPERQSDLVEVPDVSGLLYPSDDAEPVPDQDGDYFTVRVWEPELDRTDSIAIHNGYVPARIDWGNGNWACSWVKADGVPGPS